MQKILYKLSTFTAKPETKMEQILKYFSSHANLIFLIGFIFNVVLALILQKFSPPSETSISFFKHLCNYCATLIPLLLVFLLTMEKIYKLSDKSEEKINDRYKNELIDYLVKNKEDAEVKEFLTKAKLIYFFQSLPTVGVGYTQNLNSYLANIDSDKINRTELIQLTQNITKNWPLFFSDNQESLEKSIEELKLMIKKYLAKKLQKEKECAQSVNQFIDNFAEKDNLLFQKERALQASL